MAHICREAGVEGLFSAEAGVEITRRVSDKGTTIFVINNNQAEASVDFGSSRLTNLLSGEEVTGRQSIAGRDVMIFKLHD